MVKYNYNQLACAPECKNNSIVWTESPMLEERRLLRLCLNRDGEKTVTVIMMNPSKANSEHSDKTVNQLIDFFFNQPISVENESSRKVANIKYLDIVNLFSAYNPNSSHLYKNINQLVSQKTYGFFTELIKLNNTTIRDSIKDSDYIVLAWGDCPDKFNEILYYNQVVKTIKSITSYGRKEAYTFKIYNKRQDKILSITKKGNPVHVINAINGDIQCLIKVELDEYKGVVPV